MQTAPIEKIIISPNRQRREFDPADIMELANSILKNQLLHPIVVRDGPGEDDWILVAGERRLRAITELWDLGEVLRHGGGVVAKGFIPIVPIGELGELAAEEAELEENVRRKDLTWQEHALATQRLARLREKQAAAAGIPPPTIREIADETYTPRRSGFEDSYGPVQVRQELVVAAHLDDADVAKSKTVAEAYKVVLTKETAKRNAELAARVGATPAHELHTLIRGDCLDVLPRLAYESSARFDVILTDPPYGMGADSFGDSGGKVMLGVHQYRDDESTFTEVVLPALKLATDLCKGAAHAYVFCDFDKFLTLRLYLQNCGWTVFRTPLIWYKNTGRVPLPSHGPRRQYELVLYAYRGEKPCVTIQSDVLEYSTDDNLGLGAQKPVDLLVDLLRRSVAPGDRILDPFAGTGSVIPAAHQVKCRATAIEISPASLGVCLNRLEELK